jgi:hypothetical protein
MSFDEHDHDDDGEGEIEVNIDPRDEKLDALGINRDEFEEALLDALDAYNDALESDEGDITRPLEEVSITIRGTTYRLGDLAAISVEGEGEDDEDEDEDEAGGDVLLN